MSGKSDVGHSHTVSTLPVTSQQINSTSYIPTSSLTYSMNQQISSLSDAYQELNNRISDAEDANTEPNDRYESKSIGVWASISDVNNFLLAHNHSNKYRGLRVGNYVTIQDGTYNKEWVIAGFDCEYNHAASDGTTKDNGYGICMIPKTYLTTNNWHSRRAGTSMNGSDIHRTILPSIVTTLSTILGTHIVNRNVLLGSGITNNKTGSYAWTTAYATLMSVGQCNGVFASHKSKYDDGEANYKLPLFNYENYWISNGSFWTRNLSSTGSGSVERCHIYYVSSSNGNIDAELCDSTSFCVRPMIYIR